MHDKQQTLDEQAPLGAHPSYDDMVDAAVEYTFPCSDPISIDTCCSTMQQVDAGPRELDAARGKLPGR